jgi:hypothetical protein
MVDAPGNILITYLDMSYILLGRLIQVTGLQVNLYLEQPMEIQLFVTFFQRRK